jgi:hypothetical protein
VVALCRWRRFGASGSWLRASFLLSFVLPFVLFLVAPYKQVVDGRALQMEVCEAGQPQLAQLFAQYDLEPPENFCEQKPEKWLPLLQAEFKEAGLLRDPETGVCGRAAQQVVNTITRTSHYESFTMSGTGLYK